MEKNRNMSHHNSLSLGLLAFWLCLFIPATRAAAEVKPSVPVATTANPPKLGDADFAQPSPGDRHNQKVAAIRTGKYDLVLIGDSITECLESGGEFEPLKAVWNKHYAPRNAINLGYSGYRTENILWNLQNGELDFAQSPKVAVLLIGTNNTDDQHYGSIHTGEQLFAGIKAIVDLIRQRHPTTKIVIRRPFPCGVVGDQTSYHRKYNRSLKAMDELNKGGELAAKLADNQQVFWSDVNPVFLRPDGKIDPDLMPDLIHPNAAGAEAAAAALEPLITQLMGAAEPKTVYLSDLDLTRMCQGLGEPHKDKSMSNNPLSIGGRVFERGIGTHAESYFDLTLHPGAEKFTAWVGVDDEVGKNGTLEFMVYDQLEQIWSSGLMRGGEAAKAVELDIKGRTRLLLVVTDGRDMNGYDHANWAEARVTGSGDGPLVSNPPVEPAVILTPKSGPQPRINGARVFGVRPGSPFLFTIPATGERPMTFSAKGLPSGLKLDAATGRISGKISTPGTFEVTLTAKNSRGENRRGFQIVCGDKIALTPPMGWNSYNYLNANATEKIMREVADAFVAKNLINHGWTYINTDFGWNTGEIVDSVTLTLQPDPKKYPDFPGMCGYIHSLGLKVGLYSSPWMRGYSGFLGESALDAKRTQFNADCGQLGPFTFEKQDVAQWLEWEIDYMKYDWHPNDIPCTERMATALRAVPRDIVYSLSNAASLDKASDYVRLANCWRTTGDISGNWKSLSTIGFDSQDQWQPFAGPGHWNDADMMVIGHKGLSPNEQYTHMSLWCLLTGPLLLGFDVPNVDEFTLGLLTNDEVLEVNQDPLGQQAKRLVSGGDLEVWAKDMQDGSKAVGIFNRGFHNKKGAIQWADLEISGKWKVRDLWRQKDLVVRNFQTDG
jgi:alpha-galactosidase